ncbi:MAG: VanZ family protein [Oscillospiraceae bacterium]|nr:VanZ family protein [Oscillospiraceae bacterium]
MKTTMKAVFLALQITPLLALAVVTPYTVRTYRKTKCVDVWRCTYIYTFALYFICAYFITLLPLPTSETLAKLRPVQEMIQLEPFQSFRDIRLNTLFRDVAIIIFNVFLTMPLGYFLRQVFHLGLIRTTLAGFLTSLLYEVTQLTGLFFIYPRPYRIFDVDDLIINTLGAVLGWLVVPLIARYLPHTTDAKYTRLAQGSEVSFLHRSIAAAIDFALILGGTIWVSFRFPALQELLSVEHPLGRFLVFFALFMGITLAYNSLLGSRTIGYLFTGLRLLNADSRSARRKQCLLRVTLLYVCMFSIPFWVLFFLAVCMEYNGIISILWVGISAVLMLCIARNGLEVLFNAVTHGSSMFYDRIAKTHVAYGKSKLPSLFGIAVVDIKPLTPENAAILCSKAGKSLKRSNFEPELVDTLMQTAEAVLQNWIDSGLEGICELRLDKHFGRKAIMLSVHGPDAICRDSAPSALAPDSGLQLESYYAAGKNICIINIPFRKKGKLSR